MSGFRHGFPAVVIPRQVLSGRLESARPREANERASGDECLYIALRVTSAGDDVKMVGVVGKTSLYLKTGEVGCGLLVRWLVKGQHRHTRTLK